MNNRRTALYRHFSANNDNELLYVGISISTMARFSAHLYNSVWHTDVARIDVEWFGNRHLAKTAETIAIRNEKPIFNLDHNHNNYQIPRNVTFEKYMEISSREDADNFYFRIDNIDDLREANLFAKNYYKYAKKINNNPSCKQAKNHLTKEKQCNTQR